MPEQKWNGKAFNLSIPMVPKDGYVSTSGSPIKHDTELSIFHPHSLSSEWQLYLIQKQELWFSGILILKMDFLIHFPCDSHSSVGLNQSKDIPISPTLPLAMVPQHQCA